MISSSTSAWLLLVATVYVANDRRRAFHIVKGAYRR